MKIEAKVELLNVEEWNIDWTDDNAKSNQLIKLQWDMKMAIFERCGVDLSNIKIELKVSE